MARSSAATVVAVNSEEKVRDEIQDIKARLNELFGSQEDDDLPENPRLQEFLEEVKDFNYYDYECLLRFDPNQSMSGIRAKVKVYLLPVMQIVAPILLIWYEYSNIDWDATGICPDNSNVVFRSVGFIMLVYSVWQIQDAITAGPTRKLAQLEARHYATTGKNLHIRFQRGFWAHWMCGLALLFLLYFLFESSDKPVELVLNCVALNFLLGVDDEWIDERQRAKGMQAAEYLFKEFRDAACKEEDLIRELAKKNRRHRKCAEARLSRRMDAGVNVVVSLGYCLALLFLICPSGAAQQVEVQVP